MWLLIPVTLVIYLLTMFLSSNGDSGAAEIRTKANEEIKHYRAFISTADMYFKGHEAPSASTRYTWFDLKASAPPGMQNALIRADWYVVRAANGSWAACTQLHEEAAAKVAVLFPDNAGPKVTRSAEYLAIGDNDAVTAAMNLCKEGNAP